MSGLRATTNEGDEPMPARESDNRWECVDCEATTETRPCSECGSTDVEVVLSTGERFDVLDLDPSAYEVTG